LTAGRIDIPYDDDNTGAKNASFAMPFQYKKWFYTSFYTKTGSGQTHRKTQNERSMRFSVGNVEEHAANTAVGLKDNGTTLLMATIDGLDGCPMGNATCGAEIHSRLFGSRFCARRTINLPWRARDKHRESAEKERCVLAAGVNAVQLAFLMKDVLHAENAMQMVRKTRSIFWFFRLHFLIF
jgi:hypothetical protein